MLYKKNWLINCSYNPHKNNIENHLDIISRSLDLDSTKYENIVLLDDFIVCVNDEALKTFCKPYSFSSLIKQPTCFKNSRSPSCIDLMLTNKPHSFQKKCVIETGLSGFHRMTISVLKMHFRKLPPKRINYRDFKKFDNERFMDSLLYTLNEECNDYSENPDRFFETCNTILNAHAPKIKKICVGIINLSWLKRFQKLSLQRTHFRNKFWKNPTDQNKLIYNKQRTFCVSFLRKEKKEYFEKLNEKDITNNRNSRETITLVNNENIESNENEVAKTLNDFFSNIVKNYKVPEYQCEDDLHNRLSSNPVLQAILKYVNHPNINNIRNSLQRFSSFYSS